MADAPDFEKGERRAIKAAALQCNHGQLRRTCDLCEKGEQIADLTAKLAEAEKTSEGRRETALSFARKIEELSAEVARLKEIAAEFAQTNVEINGKWFAEKQARESAEAEVARLEKESRLHAGEIGNLAFAIQEHKEARESAEARLREVTGYLCGILSISTDTPDCVDNHGETYQSQALADWGQAQLAEFRAALAKSSEP